ncbi:MAG TPA: hypothetical protein VKO61_01540 [Candidatus Paceibacterota bacterium]|nr:hypothetical protein [Candidatus Paceibacterota bacterium]
MNLVKNIWDFLIKFIASIWWLFIPVLLFFIYLKIKDFYKTQKERREIEWSLLEVIPPKEIAKSPKAMEQVFTAVDEISDWASFEMVGRAGSTHFFIRIPSDYRNLIESSIYAQYPEAEINLIPEENDYKNQFPPSLPNETYDIWGTEFVLDKEDGYPIRTYPEFIGKDKEEEIVDPIAGITETMSKLKGTEAVWLQILVKPADDEEWNEDAEDVIDEILGKEKDESSIFSWITSLASGVAEFINNLFKAFHTPPSWSSKEEDDDKGGKDLTPGKRKTIEAIENKMSKIGFEAAVRFVYIDRRDAFTQSNISSVVASLRQFNTNNLNAFTQNEDIKTDTEGIFKEKTLESRKKRIFSNYVSNNFPEKTSILNTEELATIYHYPSTNVKSPLLKRVSTRRGGPPANLPVQ